MIECGVNHMLSLDQDGNVYGLGSNQYGQLGIQSEVGYVDWVQVMTRLNKLKNQYIIGLAVGDRCSIYHNRKGQVFTTG